MRSGQDRFGMRQCWIIGLAMLGALVTMTIYAHVSLDEKRKALGKLGEALG